jgi:hypothetical protein
MRVISNRMTFLIEGKPSLANVRVRFTMFRCKVRNNIPRTLAPSLLKSRRSQPRLSTCTTWLTTPR